MNFSDLIPFKKQRLNNRLNRQLFRYQSGMPISFEDTQGGYVQDAYESNPDVYSVVNGITRSASAVPPIVHEVKDVKKAQQYRRLKHSMRNGANQKSIDYALELKEQAFEDVVDERDPLYKLINQPNPLQGYPEWYENMKGFQLITGNGYTHFVELGDGSIGEMWVMPSQFTKIIANASYETLVQAYILDVYGFSGERLEAESVMHWKYWNPDYDGVGSHLYGMSPLKAVRNSIRLGNDGDLALSKAFRNGGASGVVFPDDPDIDRLTEEQRSQLEHYLRSMSGPDNYKSWLVSSAKLGFQAFGIPPVDLEILESGKHSQRDICNAFNYPSELLNDPDNKTNANKEQSRKQLYLDNVIPSLVRDFAEMNRSIVPRFKNKRYHLDFDVQSIDAIGQETSEKVSWLEKAWWLTLDEKRMEMGYEPIGDDARYIPANLIPDTTFEMTEEEIKRLKADYANTNSKA
jgi:HK97 family phage portal protein